MSTSNWGSFAFRFAVVPGNSAYVIPWDSTRLVPEYSSIAAGGAALAPGSFRGHRRRAMISYSVLCTDQNVTYSEQVLTGNAGTSADWDTQGTGTGTVTAGTETVREFRPLCPDWRLLITAGATGPTTCLVWGTVAYTEDFGS